MRALIVLHRWLGVAFCLLFAMWFASGIVMHFVPFPAFTETDRLAGLTPIDAGGVLRGPAEAVAVTKLGNVTRVRLVQRSDGPIYLISDSSRTVALHASDLSDAKVHSPDLALTIAKDYAARRQWDATAPGVVVLDAADQWTVSGQYNRDRPLYRVSLNDNADTALYISSATGEIVQKTMRSERVWNYAGSIAHWLYPTVLRSHSALWSRLLWWLSLLAMIGASAGAVIGIVHIGGGSSTYRGWQALHHWLGLACMLFVLAWIFSGWVSMDDGTLFSTGAPSASEIATVTGTPDWNASPRDDAQHLNPQTVEAEWFAFGGHIFRREQTASGVRAVLTADEINAVVGHLAPGCAPAFAVHAADNYVSASNAPIFRLICHENWFDIDATNGALIEKLDPSRRTYRWLFGGLHRLDFPFLTARPVLRTVLIVALCALGFVFSLTGVVIAWRRVLSCFRPMESR